MLVLALINFIIQRGAVTFSWIGQPRGIFYLQLFSFKNQLKWSVFVNYHQLHFITNGSPPTLPQSPSKSCKIEINSIMAFPHCGRLSLDGDDVLSVHQFHLLPGAFDWLVKFYLATHIYWRWLYNRGKIFIRFHNSSDEFKYELKNYPCNVSQSCKNLILHTTRLSVIDSVSSWLHHLLCNCCWTDDSTVNANILFTF